ncbi:hypothetical protein Athai_39670 [Actinocatenispora thailandica]|uniref:Uncharacterized protein n=1 Tax=Actinocatenispora thailandica TaxID=227318 RepID=A0A7R7DRH3_9ACTN|nr:hypothetical protein [Actinocatenispora thailandica]BCJ36464.1 hypothetical protein Athai_39670 [Actinocatenispora thailandica]
MNHQNHWYGHAHALARYCGLAAPPRIWGYLQHGWNVHDGYGADDSPAPGVPRLVWSDGPRRRGMLAGRHGYRVIGAPFAYLLATPGAPAGGAGGAVGPPPERRGTIFYPFHGWEAQSVFGDHRALAAEIVERAEPPVTICLYWLEFRHPQLREMYESFGFRVITHGPRGGHYQGTDPWFLNKQLAELRAHRWVAANRLCTAVLYGAAAGCRVGVYGDPMMIENEHPAYGGIARIRRLWPELHVPEVDPEQAAEVARQELGVRHVAPPAELADLLGWPPLGQRAGTESVA